MIAATLDLLRASGLAGAGINNIVAASGAPKGSVYHFFPGGKHELVAAALHRAEVVIGDAFGKIFGGDAALPQKVLALFQISAQSVAAAGFMKGCPIAAVTLDIDDASEDLRATADGVFATLRDVIAAGLTEIPADEQNKVAQLILATLEGALILARAHASIAPLVESGELLATTLDRAFPKSSSRQTSKKRRSTRRSREGIGQ
jgi:TetR/AcrR family transcriptional repressor of lmrAB and yxaGH operons